MFFVIPEMPSKTLVMVLKKLPGHFQEPGSGFSQSETRDTNPCFIGSVDASTDRGLPGRQPGVRGVLRPPENQQKNHW